MTEHATKPKLNVREGFKRLAIVITVAYATAFLFWLYSELATKPLLTAAIPDASFQPKRPLALHESQNPRVQFLLTLIASTPDGGIQYSERIRQALTNRFQSYTVPPQEIRLAQRSTHAANGHLLLPGPETRPISISQNTSYTDAKAILERAHRDWRWPVTFSSDGQCIQSNSYGCDETTFRISPDIHCQANLDNNYHSDRFYLDWIPATCGDLAVGIRQAAQARQQNLRNDLRNGIIGWFLGWLAAFAFGKIFWWVAAGFRR